MPEELCSIDPAAAEKLPPEFQDRSGIGVHYIKAFIKPMNTTLGEVSSNKAMVSFSSSSRSPRGAMARGAVAAAA